MLHLRSILLIVFLLLMSSLGQAHNINFEKLKNCFEWTNFVPAQGTPLTSYKNSRFMDDFPHGLSATLEANALVVHQTEPDRIVMIQNSGGKSYRLTNGTLVRKCESGRRSGGVVLPIQGTLQEGARPSTLDTFVRLQVREVAGDQREMCSGVEASQTLTPTGLTPTALSDAEMEAMVRQAILDRLKWIADHSQGLSEQMQAHSRSQFTYALKDGGACYEVLPTFPGLTQARDRVFCEFGDTSGRSCERFKDMVPQPKSDGRTVITR